MRKELRVPLKSGEVDYKYLRVFADRGVVERRVIRYFETLLSWDWEKRRAWFSNILERGNVEALIFGIKPATMFLDRGLVIEDLYQEVSVNCGLVFLTQNQSINDCSLCDPEVMASLGHRNYRKVIAESRSYWDETTWNEEAKTGVILGYPRQAVKEYVRRKNRRWTTNLETKKDIYPKNNWLTFGHFPKGKYTQMVDELRHYVRSFSIDEQYLLTERPNITNYMNEVEVWLGMRQ